MNSQTEALRSAVMARVKSKNTRPEILVRRELHRRGFRFRLHRADLPGCPDVVFPTRRAILFVHGCFWHRHADCSAAKMPLRNRGYWEAKFDRNKTRDETAQAELKKMGWNVFVVWSCELRSRRRRETTICRLVDWLNELR